MRIIQIFGGGKVLLGNLSSYLRLRLSKDIRLGSELIPLNLLMWALVLGILFSPSNILRVVLGIPSLIFIPGYTLMTALYPRKGVLDIIENIALSLGLSIAVVSLIGFILNFTTWGIRLESFLFSICSFTLITSIIATIRRRKVR